MVAPSQKIAGQGFFHLQGAGVAVKPIFVDVGGHGLSAVAAGFIDVFLTAPRKINPTVLSNVLADYFAKFPDQRSTAVGLVKAAERMEQLVHNARMGELVPNLAAVLQQLADKEIAKQPALYRGTLIENKIAALARVLHMQIDVLVVERLKTLPMRLHYHHEAMGDPDIVLRLQGDQYTPALMAHTRFTLVNSRPRQVLGDEYPSDPSLTEIIHEEDKRIATQFSNTYNRLLAMVAADELSQGDLLTAYVKGLDVSLTQSPVGTEYGNQALFDKILSELPASKLSPHQDMIDELIQALARLVSLGLPEERLFASIEDNVRANPPSTLGM